MDELPDLERIGSVITPLVVSAGGIALRQFRSPLRVENKAGPGGYDPVTEADRMTEQYLRGHLSALFPGHQIVGEECGTTGPASRVRWVIDPIDGTKAYVSGVPSWGVLLGLVIDGIPVAGWARQPWLGETFAAVRGTAWVEAGGARRPLRTRSATSLATATMYSTHPDMFRTDFEVAAFRDLAGRVRLQRFGGDCYSYCLLASGHIDLVVEASLQPYDIVPLIPIVEAAGGVITDPERKSPIGGGFVIAAATPELHAQALEIVSCSEHRAGRYEALD